jgi:hypothetical protein
MRRPPHSTRLSGALAIALLLAASFGGKLHEALVPHSICAEHGEPVELSAAVSSQTAPDSDAHTPRLVDSKSHATSHQHCELVLLGKTKGLLAPSIVTVARAASTPRESVRWTSADHETSVPLLLLAPKHSPPAIA